MTFVMFFSLILGLVVTFIQPFEYSSKARVLVVPVQDQSFDAFEAAKAAERFGEILSQVIYTSAFQEQVLTSDFPNFDKNEFSADPEKRREEWSQKLKTQVARETGMITIEVYDKNPHQAQGLLDPILYFLVNASSEYHGAGDSVKVVVVDSPLTSEKPVTPNIFLNVIISVVAGVFVSVGYVLLRTSVARSQFSRATQPRQITARQYQNTMRTEFEDIAELESTPMPQPIAHTQYQAPAQEYQVMPPVMQYKPTENYYSQVDVDFENETPSDVKEDVRNIEQVVEEQVMTYTPPSKRA